MTNLTRASALTAAAVVVTISSPVAATVHPKILRVCNGTTTRCPRGTR